MAAKQQQQQKKKKWAENTVKKECNFLHCSFSEKKKGIAHSFFGKSS